MIGWMKEGEGETFPRFTGEETDPELWPDTDFWLRTSILSLGYYEKLHCA